MTDPYEAPRNPTVEALSTALNQCRDINADLLATLQKAEISLSVLATEQARSNKRKRAAGLPEATNHIDAWNESRAAIARAEGKTDE